MRIFSRGVLTDQMLDYLGSRLEDTGVLVGDGIAPKEGGWTGGEPGKGDFVPYVVLSTGPAQKQSRDPLAQDNTSWLATYTTRHVGALRQQTDWCADKVREALVEFHPKTIHLDSKWRVLQTTYPRLGAITRNDTTDPAYWELQDDVSVWLEAHLT